MSEGRRGFVEDEQVAAPRQTGGNFHKLLPADTQFDFAFIDADKEDYLNYYEALPPRLRPGGLIAADNTLWSGKVLAPQERSDHAIVAFNDHVERDPRVEQVLLSVRDGLLLIRKHP